MTLISESSAQRVPPSLLVTPDGLDDVLGRHATVEALRRLVRADIASNHIILHGPHGVGKCMLAHLHARSIHCPASKVSGLACKACANCRSFETGGPIGYGYFNAAFGEKERERKMNAAIDIARGGGLGYRTTIVIENAHALARGEFDMMLKTLEERATTFILTTRSLTSVRPAIRSRSVDRAGARLTVDETRAQIELLLQARNIGFERATIEILTALSLGVPSRMRGLVRQFNDGEYVTPRHVRQHFGLDWPERMRSKRSGAVMSDTSTRQATPLRLSVQGKEARRRRSLLQHAFYGPEGGNWQNDWLMDPAFLHMDTDTLRYLKDQDQRWMRQAD